MELDVHLTREGQEPWGFEIVEDIGIPLTIDKVYPGSPAARVGLQPGDLVTRIGDKLTTELTLDAALDICGEAIGSLSLGVTRGLYEPVLDDFEPIYEPIEPVDFDRQSATEVYPDYDARTSVSPNFDQNRRSLSHSQTPYDFSAQLLSNSQTPQDISASYDPSVAHLSASQTPYDPSALLSTSAELSAAFDSRSVTASPFACNKTYRPFSTEPLEVPPLEEPIILNPDYKDDFSLIDPALVEEIVKTKFKLPISEQYDPNYRKKVSNILDNIGKEKTVKTDVKTNIECKTVERGSATTNFSKLESKSIEEITTKTEQSSTEVDIVETKAETTSQTIDIIISEAQSKEIYEKTQITEKTEIDLENIEQTAVEIVAENIKRAVSVTEEIQKEIEEELRASATRELDCSTEATNTQTSNVKEEITSVTENSNQRSEIKTEQFESVKESKAQDTFSEDISKTIESNEISAQEQIYIKESHKGQIEVSENAQLFQQEFVNHETSIKENRKEPAEFEEKTEVNYHESVTEKDGKQMAYNIGLQTIPNIRGMAQSSNYFDLLLRTFFIHLTDVMVALSRFILTQSISELDKTSEKIIKDKLIIGLHEVSKTNEEKREVNKDEKVMKRDIASEKRVETSQRTKAVDKTQTTEIKKQEVKTQDQLAVKNLMTESQIDKKKLTGAKIAQTQQMKSKELTQKMDAVITEFETKSGIEETIERRRSRSRSRIEEEVMSESDPLEWLDKVNRSSQERTEISSTKTATTDLKEIKTNHKTSKPGRKMYIATVESHVYTNKDAILEEQLSPTSSVQSIEEVNTAREIIDSFSENVAVKASFETATKQQAVEVITNALEDIVQEKQEVLESVSKFGCMNAESVSKTVVEDTKLIATAESIQSSTDHKHEQLGIKETKTQQAVLCSKQSLKTAIKNTDISLESRKELVESKTSTKQASVKQEFLSTTASESVETSSQSNVQVLETKSVKENVASVISANDFKAVAVESIEVPLEATTEVKEQKTAVKQAVTKQEVLTNIASEGTEVVKLESTAKTKLFEVTAKTASVTSESNFKSTVLQSETVIEESNAEIKDLKIKEETATSKIEPLSNATAETTNISMEDKVQTFESESLESKNASIKTEESYKSVAIESTEVALEAAEEEHTISFEKEALIKQDTRHLSVAGIIETKTEQDKVKTQTYDEGSASLKIIKEEVTTIDSNSIEINESEININKSLQITDIESHNQISTQETKSKLRLQTKFTANGDLEETPTPSTVPPTPLSDEYVFKLTIPLPKSRGTTPIREEIAELDHEDPHIVKKKLIPIIETKIEEQIIYDPPLPTPPVEKSEPVYTKPGLRGGGYFPRCRKEYIREIERKSSLLASAIDETIKSIEVYKEEVGLDKHEAIEEKKEEEEENVEEDNVDISEELVGYRPVAFNPDSGKDKKNVQVTFQVNLDEGRQSKLYTDASGELLGTVQGIVDSLDDATVNDQVAKELGKPGMTEEKIAELISGESEMLREAHVMGLSRVLSSHMHRPDEDSVDFNKIKPLVESLKDSEVLKALNEEFFKTQAEKKKKENEKNWTTFMQKPKRPVPKPKFGHHGYIEENYDAEEPYKVKIVKQPKPKVAPDYKPEDFNTGPLPWEERALNASPPPPVEPEEPILIPEGTPEFLEAVDPLPESEVPDLEDTGIPLPPPRQLVTPEAPQEEEPQEPEPQEEAIEEPQEKVEEDNSMADKKEINANTLIEGIKNMVDPSAPIEQQLNQMRAQLAALAQLPCVIQQSLEMLTRQLMMGQQETTQVQQCKTESQSVEETTEHHEEGIVTECTQEVHDNHDVYIEEMLPPIEEVKEENSPQPCEEEKMMEEKKEQEVMMEQDEKQRKLEILHQAIEEQMRLDQESRQLKQRSTPRVGKPKPAFGPLYPEERPLVLPGGRKWRGPKDVMNDQMIAETLQGQAEVIQGKVMGFESDILPYDKRINFMKYEKPPVSLDHLKHSEVYKVVHNMDDTPLKRVELRTPAVAEADYRERCRSVTPSTGPQQLHP